MKYIASMHAYDVLDNVQVTVLVREYVDYSEEKSELVLAQAQVFRGEGVDNAREWLRDVLVELLETL